MLKDRASLLSRLEAQSRICYADLQQLVAERLPGYRLFKAGSPTPVYSLLNVDGYNVYTSGDLQQVFRCVANEIRYPGQTPASAAPAADAGRPLPSGAADLTLKISHDLIGLGDEAFILALRTHTEVHRDELRRVLAILLPGWRTSRKHSGSGPFQLFDEQGTHVCSASSNALLLKKILKIARREQDTATLLATTPPPAAPPTPPLHPVTEATADSPMASLLTHLEDMVKACTDELNAVRRRYEQQIGATFDISVENNHIKANLMFVVE